MNAMESSSACPAKFELLCGCSIHKSSAEHHHRIIRMCVLQNNSKLAQFSMRARVALQGLTVGIMVVSSGVLFKEQLGWQTPSPEEKGR